MNISDIVILFLPVFVSLILWSFKVYERNLPENKHKMLDVFVTRVVQSIEQKTPNKAGNIKKNIAVVGIQSLFRNAHLVPPDEWVIEDAIEATVFGLKQLIASPTQAPQA